MNFTVLEKRVLNWIGERIDHEPLRDQITACRPTDRELTGVGSFTELAVSHDLPKIRLEKTNSPIRGPEIGGLSEVPDGALSLVFVDSDGYIDLLEICTYDGNFDESVVEFTFDALPDV